MTVEKLIENLKECRQDREVAIEIDAGKGKTLCGIKEVFNGCVLVVLKGKQRIVG